MADSKTLGFVLKTNYAKVERKGNQRVVTERKKFGYPVGRTVDLGSDYAEMIKLKCAVPYDPTEHPPLHKAHIVAEVEAPKKRTRKPRAQKPTSPE